MNIFALTSNDDVRRLLQAACKDGDHDLLMVNSVPSARGQLDASFDLAFVEVPVEGLTAADVMAEIRSACSKLPVVLIALEALAPAMIEACQEHGIFAYLNGAPRLSDLQGILGKAASA